MEETIKNRIIVILSISAIILLISTINANLNVRRLNRELTIQKDEKFELEKRFNSEKATLEKEKAILEEEKATLEEEKKSLSIQIEEKLKEIEELKRDLKAEKLMTETLKIELEKMAKLKEKLEEDLKEALVTKPKKK